VTPIAPEPGAADPDAPHPEAPAVDFDTICHLGLRALRDGRLETAVEMFQTAIGLRPGDAAALCKLGVAYRSLNRLEDALAC